MEAGCLNTLFSKHSMDLLAEEGTCEAYREAVMRFLGETTGQTKGEALSGIFSFMLRSYQNEYIYKALMLKKIVFGRHSPQTTSALCELPVGNSIADFVLINGHAQVYEIKTDLDNFSRLRDQIEDYFHAFRYVSIVCSEKNAQHALDFINETPVGLMILTKRLTFRTLVEPKCWDKDLDSFIQFDLLRKSEREDVLQMCGEELPVTTPARYYSECLTKFKDLSFDLRNMHFEQVLKKRMSNLNRDALKAYPDEFKLIAYNHGANYIQGSKLQSFMKSDYL